MAQLHPLVWAGSWAEHKKILSGISNWINYGETFIVCTEFTDLAMGHVIQRGRPMWKWSTFW